MAEIRENVGLLLSHLNKIIKRNDLTENQKLKAINVFNAHHCSVLKTGDKKEIDPIFLQSTVDVFDDKNNIIQKPIFRLSYGRLDKKNNFMIGIQMLGRENNLTDVDFVDNLQVLKNIIEFEIFYEDIAERKDIQYKQPGKDIQYGQSGKSIKLEIIANKQDIQEIITNLKSRVANNPLRYTKKQSAKYHNVSGSTILVINNNINPDIMDQQNEVFVANRMMLNHTSDIQDGVLKVNLLYIPSSSITNLMFNFDDNDNNDALYPVWKQIITNTQDSGYNQHTYTLHLWLLNPNYIFTVYNKNQKNNYQVDASGLLNNFYEADDYENYLKTTNRDLATFKIDYDKTPILIGTNSLTDNNISSLVYELKDSDDREISKEAFIELKKFTERYHYLIEQDIEILNKLHLGKIGPDDLYEYKPVIKIDNIPTNETFINLIKGELNKLEFFQPKIDTKAPSAFKTTTTTTTTTTTEEELEEAESDVESLESELDDREEQMIDQWDEEEVEDIMQQDTIDNLQNKVRKLESSEESEDENLSGDADEIMKKFNNDDNKYDDELEKILDQGTEEEKARKVIEEEAIEKEVIEEEARKELIRTQSEEKSRRLKEEQKKAMDMMEQRRIKILKNKRREKDERDKQRRMREREGKSTLVSIFVDDSDELSFKFPTDDDLTKTREGKRTLIKNYIKSIEKDDSIIKVNRSISEISTRNENEIGQKLQVSSFNFNTFSNLIDTLTNSDIVTKKTIEWLALKYIYTPVFMDFNTNIKTEVILGKLDTLANTIIEKETSNITLNYTPYTNKAYIDIVKYINYLRYVMSNVVIKYLSELNKNNELEQNQLQFVSFINGFKNQNSTLTIQLDSAKIHIKTSQDIINEDKKYIKSLETYINEMNTAIEKATVDTKLKRIAKQKLPKRIPVPTVAQPDVLPTTIQSIISTTPLGYRESSYMKNEFIQTRKRGVTRGAYEAKIIFTDMGKFRKRKHLITNVSIDYNMNKATGLEATYIINYNDNKQFILYTRDSNSENINFNEKVIPHQGIVIFKLGLDNPGSFKDQKYNTFTREYPYYIRPDNVEGHLEFQSSDGKGKDYIFYKKEGSIDDVITPYYSVKLIALHK